jgi:hypothetical protein
VLIGILDSRIEECEGNIYVTFFIQRRVMVFFAPRCVADFGTLNAMTGKSTQPAHGSGNVAD